MLLTIADRSWVSCSMAEKLARPAKWPPESWRTLVKARKSVLIAGQMLKTSSRTNAGITMSHGEYQRLYLIMGALPLARALGQSQAWSGGVGHGRAGYGWAVPGRNRPPVVRGPCRPVSR